MRALLVLLPLLAGCRHAGEIALAAAAVVGVIAQAAADQAAADRAEYERQKQLSEYERRLAAEHHEREKEWHARRMAGAEYICTNLRSYRLSCVAAASGFTCFWQTSDHQIFACPDGDC